MIFQYTLDNVLNGTKTQTRRVRRPQDEPIYDAQGQIHAVTVNGRTKWQVGKTYAVIPARGQKQVARIRLLVIRTEAVRDISEEDAVAEGYTTRDEFFATWEAANGADTLDRDVWALTFQLITDVD